MMERHEPVSVGKDLDLTLGDDDEGAVGPARLEQDLAGFNGSDAAKQFSTHVCDSTFEPGPF